jgi:hypothetical protein
MKSLNALALNLGQQLRYDEAEALYKRGLALVEKGRDTGPIASVLSKNLAALQNRGSTEPKSDWKLAWTQLSDEAVRLSSQKNPQLAEDKAREALALAEKYDDPQQRHLASSQDLLAQMLWHNKKADEAESLLKSAISIIERSGEGKALNGLAKVMTTLAKVHEYQKRDAEAELVYKRVIALREKQAEQDVPATIESMAKLAEHYFYRNRRSPEYAPLLRRLITLQEKQLGPEHLDLAKTLETLGWLIHLEGIRSKSPAHYAEAESHYKRALTIAERSPSAKTKALQLRALRGLRDVYSATNQEQAAEQIRQREKALES